MYTSFYFLRLNCLKSKLSLSLSLSFYSTFYYSILTLSLCLPLSLALNYLVYLPQTRLDWDLPSAIIECSSCWFATHTPTHTHTTKLCCLPQYAKKKEIKTERKLLKRKAKEKQQQLHFLCPCNLCNKLCQSCHVYCCCCCCWCGNMWLQSPSPSPSPACNMASLSLMEPDLGALPKCLRLCAMCLDCASAIKAACNCVQCSGWAGGREGGCLQRAT